MKPLGLLLYPELGVSMPPELPVPAASMDWKSSSGDPSRGALRCLLKLLERVTERAKSCHGDVPVLMLDALALYRL